MRSPFSLQNDISRPAYFGHSATALALQIGIGWLARAPDGQPSMLPWWFWLNPLRTLVLPHTAAAGPVLLAAMVLSVVLAWMLVALAIRRTRQAELPLILAALAAVPFLQILIVAGLSVAPARKRAEPQAPAAAASNIPAAGLGFIIGAGLCVAAVAFSTLVLHTYGYALFLAAPLVIGVTVGYVVNRRAEVTAGRTTQLVLSSLAMGSIALLGFALEGFICLLFAAPLIAAFGWLGGLAGREMARAGRKGRDSAMMSIALLPLLMLGERAMPPKAEFESVESIEIAAPPAAVWDSIVHMGPIPDAPAPPFRWGLAYPMRGRIVGGGVGAVREGVFSTGVAYERVTVWEPDHRLFFVVLSDPPTMRELSPYAHVNAPHTEGYFRTADARFTITPLANGKTRLTLATHHALDLEPALYWMPFAQWAVHANKVRVLGHFRTQAEASTR